MRPFLCFIIRAPSLFIFYSGIIIIFTWNTQRTIAVRETVCSRRPPTDGPSVEAQRSLDHLVFVGRHRHRRRFSDAKRIHREWGTDVSDDDWERRSGERVDTMLRRSSSFRVDLRFRHFENSSHGRDAKATFGGGIGSSRRWGARTVTLLQQ